MSVATLQIRWLGVHFINRIYLSSELFLRIGMKFKLVGAKSVACGWESLRPLAPLFWGDSDFYLGLQQRTNSCVLTVSFAVNRKYKVISMLCNSSLYKQKNVNSIFATNLKNMWALVNIHILCSVFM